MLVLAQIIAIIGIIHLNVGSPRAGLHCHIFVVVDTLITHRKLERVAPLTMTFQRRISLVVSIEMAFRHDTIARLSMTIDTLGTITTPYSSACN